MTALSTLGRLSLSAGALLAAPTTALAHPGHEHSGLALLAGAHLPVGADLLVLLVVGLCAGVWVTRSHLARTDAHARRHRRDTSANGS
jgi:hydrogenase/urease accessory protein HupE